MVGFFDGIGVCAGFAKSFQYLALMENTPCIIVHGQQKFEDGSVDEVGHAWCMAQLEGEWYHFDPTWGVRDINRNVDFTFFCRSTERISQTHSIDYSYPLPKLGDDSLSYVSMIHRFVAKYDERAVSEILMQAFFLIMNILLR